MVRPGGNRKRRQILACLTMHETMGWGSLSGTEPSQIHQGYFGKISLNLLWYYRADISYDIGSQEELKAFARLDRRARYPVISAMSDYSQGHRADVLPNSPPAIITVDKLQIAMTFQLSITNSVFISQTLMYGSFVSGTNLKQLELYRQCQPASNRTKSPFAASANTPAPLELCTI